MKHFHLSQTFFGGGLKESTEAVKDQNIFSNDCVHKYLQSRCSTRNNNVDPDEPTIKQRVRHISAGATQTHLKGKAGPASLQDNNSLSFKAFNGS